MLKDKEGGGRRDWRAFRELIQAHRAGAEAFLNTHKEAIEEYQSFPSDGENSTPAVLGMDNIPQTMGSKPNPKLRMNLLYPHIQTIVASIVPSNPTARPVPRIPYTTDPGDPVPVAIATREAAILDSFQEDNFVDTLREATRISSALKYAVIFSWWDEALNRTMFETHSPLTAWFDPTVRRANKSPYFIIARAIKYSELKSMVGALCETDHEDIWVPEDLEELVKNIHDKTSPDFYKVMETSAKSAADTFHWVVTYDIFDYATGTFQKWVRGIEDQPIMCGPLPHKYVSRQFYVITLNNNLVDGTGLSDWALVRGALKQQAEALTLLLNGARSAIRILLADEEAFEDPEAVRSAYARARSNDMVMASMKDNRKLRDSLEWSTSPGTAPDVRQIIELAERSIRTTLTAPEHSSGQVGGSNNATEVALADAAVKTAQEPRAATVNRAVSWAAATIIQFLAEKLPPGIDMPARQTVQSGAKGVPINRKTMMLPDFQYEVNDSFQVTASLAKWRDNFVYEVEAAFSDASSQLTRLRMLEQWQKFLFESPHVDKKAVTAEILSLLHLVAALQDAPEAPPGMLPEGAPLGGPAPLAPGPGQLEGGLGTMPRMPGEDGISTGALPLGVGELDLGNTSLGGPGNAAPFK
jgi:hypothetical protein